MVLKIEKNLPIALVFVFLGGCCIFPGDGGITLSGEAPDNKPCYLALWNENATEEYVRKDVSGKFNRTFIVSACRETFTLKAVCDSKITKQYKIGPYDEASYERPYKLGNIAP